MKFIENLYDIEGCDCSKIMLYSDIQLQGVFGGLVPTQEYVYALQVEAFGLDGANYIGDISANFDFQVVRIVGSTNAYFNMISLRIPNLICDNKCFRLKVVLKSSILDHGVYNTSVVFQSFTDCMSVDSCCVTIPKDGIKINITA